MADALAQALQNLNQLVANLTQQIQNHHQPPPPQPVFTLSPLGSSTPGQFGDFTTKDGRKFHSRDNRQLFLKDDYFYVETFKSRTFMTQLAGHCKDLEFMVVEGTCMVSPDAAQPNVGERINTVEDFKRTSMEQVFWKTTLLAATAGVTGRQAQESKMTTPDAKQARAKKIIKAQQALLDDLDGSRCDMKDEWKARGGRMYTTVLFYFITFICVTLSLDKYCDFLLSAAMEYIFSTFKH